MFKLMGKEINAILGEKNYPYLDPWKSAFILIFALLNLDIFFFKKQKNNVHPDKLASKEAISSGSTLFPL